MGVGLIPLGQSNREQKKTNIDKAEGWLFTFCKRVFQTKQLQVEVASKGQ
jgi:hypothetical protein